MSAATDRLPVKLQAMILAHVFGSKIANAGMNLLVARPYITGPGKAVGYAVGQPMGALSSGAMLAVTHHFMGQGAAFRAGVILPGGWFKFYAVLGDDSAAANRRVVQEYLKICSELGVKVNLAKSLLSPKGCLEFAKRFVTPFGNCSPVSIGEILVSKKNFATMSNLPRKRKIRISDLLSIMGYRHKVSGSLQRRFAALPKRARNMLIVLLSPWGAFPSKSLIEGLSLEGYDRRKEKDFSYLCVNILCLVDKLRVKVIRIVNANNQNYKMTGIGGDKERETMTQKVREVDPQTFRVLMDAVLEPARKDIFFKAVSLLIKVKNLEDSMCKRAYLADIAETSGYGEDYLTLEKEYHALFGGDVYLQAVEKPFVEPSPKQILSLRQKLLVGGNYSSEVPIPAGTQPLAHRIMNEPGFVKSLNEAKKPVNIPKKQTETIQVLIPLNQAARDAEQSQEVLKNAIRAKATDLMKPGARLDGVLLEWVKGLKAKLDRGEFKTLQDINSAFDQRPDKPKDPAEDPRFPGGKLKFYQDALVKAEKEMLSEAYIAGLKAQIASIKKG